MELNRGSTLVPGAGMVINAGGTEQHGAVATFKGTCMATVSLAARAPTRAPCGQTSKAVPESLPEPEHVHKVLAAEAAHFMSREAADKHRAARARKDASVLQGESSWGVGGADDGSPFQEEPMLGGDPDPVLPVVAR